MDGGSNPAGDITNLHYNFVVAKPLVLCICICKISFKNVEASVQLTSFVSKKCKNDVDRIGCAISIKNSRLRNPNIKSLTDFKYH